MFQYAAAFALLKGAGSKLAIDASDFERFTRHTYLLGGWRLSGRLIPDADWRALTYKTLHQREFPNGLSMGDKALISKRRMVGEWRDHRYFAAYREQLRNELQPRQLSSAQTSVIDELRTSPSLVVLISPADFVVQTRDLGVDAWPLSARTEFYEEAVGMMLESNPDVRVKLFASDRSPFVPPSLRKFAGGAVISVNERSAGDMYMLTHGKHFVIPASWFAWWVAWIADSPGKQVIAPRRWQALRPSTRQPAMPEEWILI